MSPRRVVAPDAGHRDAAGVASDLVVVGTKVDQLAAVPDTFAADRASKDNPVRRERQGVITIIVVVNPFSFEDLHVQDLPAVSMIWDVERAGATGGEVDPANDAGSLNPSSTLCRQWGHIKEQCIFPSSPLTSGEPQQPQMVG
jgi:hypothetical protein